MIPSEKFGKVASPTGVKFFSSIDHGVVVFVFRGVFVNHYCLVGLTKDNRLFDSFLLDYYTVAN